MKVFYAASNGLPLPQGHRFPVQKYTSLVETVIQSGLFDTHHLQPVEPATFEQISLVHDQDYIQRVFDGQLSEKELRRIGFPWSPELVDRSRRSVSATIHACQAALQDGLAVNLGGGTHHAYPDHGEGYCVFNDVATAARATLAAGMANRIIILDCDVHQGNGTAAIFINDPAVYTFSIHGERNFPFHKEHSDLDIALPDMADDRTYLDALEPGLMQALEQSRADLGIYIAGADPFVGDRLGRMALSKQGLLTRDNLVLDRCQTFGLPLAIVMGGGYAPNVQDIVDIHFNTIQAALRKEKNETVS